MITPISTDRSPSPSASPSSMGELDEEADGDTVERTVVDSDVVTAVLVSEVAADVSPVAGALVTDEVTVVLLRGSIRGIPAYAGAVRSAVNATQSNIIEYLRDLLFIFSWFFLSLFEYDSLLLFPLVARVIIGRKDQKIQKKRTKRDGRSQTLSQKR